MRKATKLYALLGVLLVVCIAAFAVSRYEEKKEQIKNSGEVILEIPTDSAEELASGHWRVLHLGVDTKGVQVERA